MHVLIPIPTSQVGTLWVPVNSVLVNVDFKFPSMNKSGVDCELLSFSLAFFQIHWR